MKMFFWLSSFGFLLITSELLAQSEMIARVNKETITTEDFNQQYQESLKFFSPDQINKKALLEDMIKQKLVIQEANKTDLRKEPEVINKINAILYTAFLEKKLAKKVEGISITNEEVQSYCAKTPEIRTSQIFVRLKQNASGEEKKQALEKITQVRELLDDKAASFSEVAQKFSEGPTAQMGGDIDYQLKEQLGQNYYNAALKLKTPGKISEVIRTPFGYVIIKLTGIRTCDDTDTAKIRGAIFNQKRNEIIAEYIESLKQKANISIHSKSIKD